MGMKDELKEKRKAELEDLLQFHYNGDEYDMAYARLSFIMNGLGEGYYVNPINNPGMTTNAYLYAIMQQNLIIIDLLNRIADK